MKNQHDEIAFYQRLYTNGHLLKKYGVKYFQYSDREFFCCILWNGRKTVPSHHCRFHKETERTHFLSLQLNIAKTHHDQKMALRIKRSSFVPALTPGQIFICSWGWEQTNIDFYQIIDLPSQCYAVVQRIAHQKLPSNQTDMSCYVIAMKDHFISAKQHKVRISINSRDSSCYFKTPDLSNAYSRPYDGRPVYMSSYA